MPQSKKILVTGSTGGVGQAVCNELLKAGHRVTGFDRDLSTGLAHSFGDDITDRQAVLTAVAGMDAVIHLAATPDEADFIDELIEPNVRGLYHVCDAVRQHGVPRLILASSAQVVAGHSWAQAISIEDGPHVINHYALTKLWAEQMGEMYARVYGIEVIVARLAWLPRDQDHAQELLASSIGVDVYLSPGDAGRFFRACIEAELVPGQFEVVFAASRAVNQLRFDPEPARRVTGFEAQDTWPEGQSYTNN